MLVEAAALVRGRQPELRVLVAGDGAERGRLESLIEELGLADCVLLLGTRSDVPDVLVAADVAVCCSDFEGTPLSVMEYMGAGKPVVATRVGGLPEVVEDGVQGLLVEPRDPANLADALARLLEGESLRRRLGEAARPGSAPASISTVPSGRSRISTTSCFSPPGAWTTGTASPCRPEPDENCRHLHRGQRVQPARPAGARVLLRRARRDRRHPRAEAPRVEATAPSGADRDGVRPTFSRFASSTARSFAERTRRGFAAARTRSSPAFRPSGTCRCSDAGSQLRGDPPVPAGGRAGHGRGCLQDDPAP